MGVIIKCDDKILHSTYTDFNLMKQHFLNGYFKYLNNYPEKCLHNNDFQNVHNDVYGIYIIEKPQIILPEESVCFIKAIEILNNFIYYTQNMYILKSMFYYSVEKKKNIIIL
jgi:hypothetical protein